MKSMLYLLLFSSTIALSQDRELVEHYGSQIDILRARNDSTIQDEGNNLGPEINKIDSYGTDGKGDTLLLLACKGCSTTMVAALLDRGADPSFPHGITGQTPLHIAAEKDNATLINLLLHHKAEIGACNNASQTPVQLARLLEKHRAVQALESWERGERPAQKVRAYGSSYDGTCTIL